MEQAIQITGRSRRSKQQIQDLLSEFEKSKATAKDFCIQYSINPANFHKWKSRYKVAAVNKGKRAGFAKLDVGDSSILSGGLFAEVNGIKIFQPVSASFLKELIA